MWAVCPPSGAAQGHGRLTPTAVSQIIEALCKLTVGLGLAYWLVKQGADASHAAGAITGVTVGHHRGPGLYADELPHHPGQEGTCPTTSRTAPPRF